MSITNIVATSSLSCKVDIQQISQILDNATYKVSRIKALTYKFKDGGCCRVFSSGKLVVLGKRCLQNITENLQELADLEEGLGFPVCLKPATVVTLLVFVVLGHPLTCHSYTRQTGK